MTTYTYEKQCALDRLTLEIQQSAIVTALSHMTGTVAETRVVFKAELSSGDEELLDGVVAAHVNTPLPNTPEPTDSDGSRIVRAKVTKSGWHYEPRSISWKCGGRASLCNKNPSLADLGDAVLKFYNASDVALTQGAEESDGDFQARLASDCVKTVVDWWPQHDIDIIGGILFVKNVTADQALVHVVAAPDIPAILGGSVPFQNGGFDLSFFHDAGTSQSSGRLDLNGRGAKTLVFDPVYASNKLRFSVNHPVGYAASLMILFEGYKE